MPQASLQLSPQQEGVLEGRDTWLLSPWGHVAFIVIATDSRLTPVQSYKANQL